MTQIEEIITKINRNQDYVIDEISSNSEVYRLIKLEEIKDGNWKKKEKTDEGFFLGQHNNQAFMFPIESLKSYKEVPRLFDGFQHGYKTVLCDSYNNFFSNSLRAKVTDEGIQLIEDGFTFTKDIGDVLPLEGEFNYAHLGSFTKISWVSCPAYRMEGYGVTDPDGCSTIDTRETDYYFGQFVKVRDGIVVKEDTLTSNEIWVHYDDRAPWFVAYLAKEVQSLDSLILQKPPLAVQLQLEHNFEKEAYYQENDSDRWKESVIQAMKKK